MNDIPKDLIFNWDHTAIQLLPTGDWTMNEAKAKKVIIANSNDKRQITTVLVVTMTGEHLEGEYYGKFFSSVHIFTLKKLINRKLATFACVKPVMDGIVTCFKFTWRI